jgi:peptidyl-tRNA hydrolase|tara:strand:- start:168 stop:401 length:234 start_codon:yes stop_codon:yes gene_type:complete
MKESTLIQMKNKIEALTNVVNYLMQDTTHLRELSVGTLETLKLMPGYQDAIDELKTKMEENVKEKMESNGSKQQDTK